MDDLISRQEAIKYFTELWECVGIIGAREEWEDVCATTANEIKSAQPEPHEGHWIEGGIYRDVIECHCSECGQLMTTAATVRMNYCPHCGAKMKGAKD